MASFYGAYNTVPDGTAVPAGDGVGLLLSAVGGRTATDWVTKVTIVASGAFDFGITCWARDSAGDWGPLGMLSGDINGGATFAGAAGTHHFYLGGEFLGLPAELYYQVSNTTNVTSTTVRIAPVMVGSL